MGTTGLAGGCDVGCVCGEPRVGSRRGITRSARCRRPLCRAEAFRLVRFLCRCATSRNLFRKSRSSSVDELAAVIAYGVVLNQLSWNWRECWQPAGSHASHWVARVGQARRCEASAWMSRRPSAAMVETLDHCGEPRAAGGADTSLAWYTRISCVRASVLPSLKKS